MHAPFDSETPLEPAPDTCCPSRRDLLRGSALGFASVAMHALLGRNATAEMRREDGRPPLAIPASLNPLAQRIPHFRPRARRVIFLFMHGGPSQIDTFDYKPLLDRDDGKPLPFPKPRVTFAETGNLLRSPWKFRQRGASGMWVSELFPHVATQVDKLCFIKSLHGTNEAHGGALLALHTGSNTFVRPSMGSWITYGLGSENENLPGFLTICPTLGHGGVNNWSSAFLPGAYQGTPIGNASVPAERATIEHLKNADLSPDLQRHQLDFIQSLNRAHLGARGEDDALASRILSFELAFRMQSEAPELMSIDGESETTKQRYGLDQKHTMNFGRQCLMARRFAEAGVRFIQCTHSYKWDQHDNLKAGHEKNALEVDQPIAALLEDLELRGLLEDTLVIWGGEFGRTPVAQGKDGRDHNPHGFTIWMAGGGVKPGFSYGATDEYGYYAVEDKMHVHDFHATLLALLGLDHERLTFRSTGRDFRLTDVAGTVADRIFA